MYPFIPNATITWTESTSIKTGILWFIPADARIERKGLPMKISDKFRAIKVHVTAARLGLVYIVCLGLFLTFAVPPFQKPDEIVHFYKTVAVAAGTIGCKHDAGGRAYAMIPSYLEALPRDLLSQTIANDFTVKFGLSRYKEITSRQHFDTRLVPNYTGCSLPFAYYMLPALIISLPVALGANPVVIFFVGRSVNLFIGLLLFFFAFKIVPAHLKRLVFLVMALPTVLFQIGSYSKDAPHLGFGMVAIALYLGLRSGTLKPAVKWTLLLFFMIAVSVLARPQYLPLFLLPAAVMDVRPFWRRLVLTFSSYRLSHVVLLSIAAAVSAAVGIFLVIFYIQKLDALLVRSTLPYIYPSLQVRYLQEHIWSVIPLYTATYRIVLPEVYAGLIGITGWLTGDFPWILEMLFGAVFVFEANRLSETVEIRRREAFLYGAIIFSTWFLITLPLYIFSTPVASSWIWGIQGRYFILILPFILLLAAYVMQRPFRLLAFFVLLVAAVGTMLSVYSRYYAYSDYYFREPQAADAETVGKSAVIVDERRQEILSVDPGRQFTGVSVFISAHNTATKPYRAAFYTPDCRVQLADKVIDMSSLSSGQFADIRIEPYQPGTTSLCWSLEPYEKLQEPGNNLMLVRSSVQGNVAVPLYLF